MDEMDYKRVEHLGKTSIVIKFYKAMRWCWTHKLPFLAKILWRLIQILFACYIPPTAILKEGVRIAHGVGIVIHQNSVIGEGTIIFQNVTVGSGKGPKIGKNCVLGVGCCVLGDITLGNNVKVGANAVVLESVPDNCTVVGIPARIIKRDGEKISAAEGER